MIEGDQNFLNDYDEKNDEIVLCTKTQVTELITASIFCP